MISYINSRSNKRVVYASSLKNKNNIKDNQEFLLEGKKSIELALKAKLVKEIFTLKEIKASYDIPSEAFHEGRMSSETAKSAFNKIANKINKNNASITKKTQIDTFKNVRN